MRDQKVAKSTLTILKFGCSIVVSEHKKIGGFLAKNRENEREKQSVIQVLIKHQVLQIILRLSVLAH